MKNEVYMTHEEMIKEIADMDKMDIKSLALNLWNSRGHAIMAVWSVSMIVGYWIVLPVLGGLRLSYAVDAITRNASALNVAYGIALSWYVGSGTAKKLKAMGNGGLE